MPRRWESATGFSLSALLIAGLAVYDNARPRCDRSLDFLRGGVAISIHLTLIPKGDDQRRAGSHQNATLPS